MAFSLLRTSVIRVVLLVFVVCACLEIRSQTQGEQTKQADSVDVERVVSEIVSSESKLLNALRQFEHRCDVVVQTINNNGKVRGEYRRSTQVDFGENGNRSEKMLLFPKPSLTDIAVTREDLEALSAAFHFTLNAENKDKYRFVFTGRAQSEAKAGLLMLDVEPKIKPTKEPLFAGRIWVDANGKGIVKMRGRAVAKGNQSFPMMEMFRKQAAEFMFPSAVIIDDQMTVLGRTMRLHIEVGYSDYVKMR